MCVEEPFWPNVHHVMNPEDVITHFSHLIKLVSRPNVVPGDLGFPNKLALGSEVEGSVFRVCKATAQTPYLDGPGTPIFHMVCSGRIQIEEVLYCSSLKSKL